MKNKTLIKIWIVIIISCVVCFSDWSFAVDDKVGEVVADMIDIIVNVLSWIWILFAKIAWNLFTNKWVYGEVIWLDVLLWKYWNIVKNIANFCLWFYFVYVIFKWLIGKTDAIKTIRDKLLRILIAWVWIQVSWFLTAVVVDVSTITMVAVWSFPAQVVAWNEKVYNGINDSVYAFFWENSSSATTWFVYDLFPTYSESYLEKVVVDLSNDGEPLTKEKFFDLLLPNADSVSWPLYYIWFSILKTNEVSGIKTFKNIKSSILNLIIQWWTTIIYSIEMGVLCVLAVMRIVYLWMFIVLSPLIIFLWCVKKDVENIWFVKSIMEQMNIKSFLLNVFKPTIIVLWIWLAMIFASLMNSVINKNGKTSDKVDLWWVVVESKEESDIGGFGKKYSTTMDVGMVNFTISNAAKWILDFIMSILTVVLVYIIISETVKMWNWKDFISKKLEGLQKTVWETVTSVPVMPVAWYNEQWKPETHYLSASRVFNGNGWLIWEKIKRYQQKVDKMYWDQDRTINSWFWNNWWYLSDDEIKKIQMAGASELSWMKVLEAKKEAIVKSEEWKWMKLNSSTASNGGFWKNQFTDWLNERMSRSDYDDAPEGWKNMINDWKNLPSEDRTLKALFDISGHNHARTYANFFGYTWNYSNFDSIENLDISKK